MCSTIVLSLASLDTLHCDEAVPSFERGWGTPLVGLAFHHASVEDLYYHSSTVSGSAVVAFVGGSQTIKILRIIVCVPRSYATSYKCTGLSVY